MASQGSRRSASESGQYGARQVVFWVGPRCLSLSIAVVREVVDLRQLTPVPMAPPAVLGIISLRGTILSVLDAEQVLTGTVAAVAATKILVLVRDGVAISGLAVQRVVGVAAMPAADFLHNHGASQELVSGYHDLGRGELVAVIDPDALFRHIDALRFATTSNDATAHPEQEIVR